MDTLSRFFAILDKRDNFCVFLFAFQLSNFICKWEKSERKYLLPVVTNSFLLEFFYFPQGWQTFFNRVASPGIVSISLKYKNVLKFSEILFVYSVLSPISNLNMLKMKLADYG